MRTETKGVALHQMTHAQVDQFIAWAGAARDRTTFDPLVLSAPRCAMYTVEGSEGHMAYLPVQTVLMAEVFIPRPGSSNRERALCLGRFDAALMKTAESIQVRDVYTFIPTTEADYAEKVKRHGWVEIPNVRLFKKSSKVGT